MSKFVQFRYLDDDNTEHDVVLNTTQIVSILPYEEESGTLITLINDEEFLVTTEFAEVAELSKTW
jgi:hypothetical protein